MSVATVKSRQVHPPGLDLGAGLSRIGPGPIGLLIGAIAWEVIGRVAGLSFFPPLSAVLVRLVELTAQGKIIGNLANSLANLALGFGISAIVGVGIGILMGAYRKVDMALDFYVYALLTAPSLVFAPLFFSMFGAGNSRLSILAVIVMYTLFIIIVNTAAAIRNVPRPLVEMGRSFCANDRQLFLRIIIPAALPLIMAGLRLGMGRAIKGMINGEMFIAVVGLGDVVQSAGKRFDAEGVLAVLLVIITVALVAVKLVQIVDLRLTGWLPSTARQRRRNP
jgi:ABC-type nitrate/sulfonate/bicarbonate transport system permease component